MERELNEEDFWGDNESFLKKHWKLFFIGVIVIIIGFIFLLNIEQLNLTGKVISTDGEGMQSLSKVESERNQKNTETSLKQEDSFNENDEERNLLESIFNNSTKETDSEIDTNANTEIEEDSNNEIILENESEENFSNNTNNKSFLKNSSEDSNLIENENSILCSENEIYCEGSCITPNCFNNLDCEDGNSCTKNICQDSGICSASCFYEQINENLDGDGCCLNGMDYSKDSDCPLNLRISSILLDKTPTDVSIDHEGNFYISVMSSDYGGVL